MTTDTLEHHGIKGQKWGVRRTPEQLGHKPSSGRKRSTGKKTMRKSSGGKRPGSASRPKKKKISELSDAELKAKIARLELEKKYTDLKKDQERLDRGKTFVTDVLESVGRNSLTNLGTQAANHAIGTMINKMYGITPDSPNYEKIRIVNPQKGQSDKK